MIYDCVIIGGGPAGLTAGIYLARANKKVAIIEKMSMGGQVSEIGLIENYPGFTKISGAELSDNMFRHAKAVGVEFIFGEVLSLDLNAKSKKVILAKSELEAKSIILAIGSMPRVLNIENERKFIGKGVSYCATCDGNFFKGKDVAVVGSGDSAVSCAQYLSPIAKKVYIISKYEQMKLINASFSQIEELDNVKFIASTKVLDILGDDLVRKVKIEGKNGVEELKVDGVFVSIGRNPETEWLKGIIDLDEKGYINADSEMRTSLDGVFVAGDIVSGSLKQIVTASSSGAIASMSVLKYLNSVR